MTSEQLEMTEWWWCLPKWKDPMKHWSEFGSAAFDWKRGEEVIAFKYEMVRRANRTKHFLPFPRVPFDHRGALCQIFELPTLEIVCYHSSDLQLDNDPKWTKTDPSLRWNLSLSDAVLVRAFKAQIQQARRFQNVKVTRHAATQRRRPSWHLA